ncbi:MAG: hypothetical protein AB7S26_11155 [Sandaracinaceae bacterium]
MASIRERAVRAARVVTLGLAAAGCYGSHERAPDRDPVRPEDDAGPELADAGIDAGVGAGVDAGVDAGDVLCDVSDEWEEYQRCCDAIGWDFDRGCYAWGPYVPPGAIG